VPKPGETPTQAALEAALGEYLAGYKIPGHIVFIDQGELPWTASGKIRVPEVGKLIAERLGLPA
jgi:acyl-CoA synthetase (AMP-forming)/AMP-acid ligase II